MLNPTDKIMLGSLLGLLALSGGMLWQDKRSLSVADEVIVPATPLTPAISAVSATAEEQQEMPEFSQMVDVKAKKSAFFAYLLPVVQQENNAIQKNRETILALSSHSGLSDADQSWLADIAQKYRMTDVKVFDGAFFQALLSRVDTIPPSLALAQAANESAWGTSRFARQGNNFFGQWCFRPGCGIVPASRPEGETYEVQKFDNVAASVRAYMHNLNANHQYQRLRDLRQQRRAGQESVTGADLVHGLQAYSIRGKAYIEELLSMINTNKLLQYDTVN